MVSFLIASEEVDGAGRRSELARRTYIVPLAGLGNIKIEKLDTTSSLGKTAAEAANESLNIGPVSRAANDLPDAERTKARDAIEKVFTQHVTSVGVAPKAACWLVSATR